MNCLKYIWYTVNILRVVASLRCHVWYYLHFPDSPNTNASDTFPHIVITPFKTFTLQRRHRKWSKRAGYKSKIYLFDFIPASLSYWADRSLTAMTTSWHALQCFDTYLPRSWAGENPSLFSRQVRTPSFVSSCSFFVLCVFNVYFFSF
jgi:hypothetical protein